MTEINDFIDYDIKRETKIIRFNDINEVEEETIYYLKFNTKITSSRNYLLRTPFPYFRIPEEIPIEIINKFNEIESKNLIEKLIWYYIFEIIFKNSSGEWEDFRIKQKKKMEEKNYKTNLKEVDNDYWDEKIKEAQELTELIEMVKILKLIEKLDDIKNKKQKREEIKKIENKLDDIKKEEQSAKKVKDYSNKINRIRENINRLENIDVKGVIGNKENFKKILEYPFTKRKVFFHHNWQRYRYNFTINILFFVISYFLAYFLTKLYIPIIFPISLLIVLSFIFIIGRNKIFNLIYNRKAKNSLMKGGDLKQKFKDSIKYFLTNSVEKINQDKENLQIENVRRTLFLDSLSEMLFNEIYRLTYNDLDKFITDYKSFNPISMDIYFENEKLLPIETNTLEFFHKTTIPISLTKNQIKNNYSLIIKTKRTLRKYKKKKRFINYFKNIPKKYMSIGFLIILLGPIFLIISIFYLSFIYIFYIFLFQTIFLFIFMIFGIFRKNYYYSPSSFKNFIYDMGDLKKEDFLNKISFSANSLSYLRNINKKIFPITINLRKDCSYYFNVYAPRFHYIKMAKELDFLMNLMSVKSPYNLSQNLFSFNIPRRKKLKALDIKGISEIEFDIDLEIPRTVRINLWLLGIFLMIILMLLSGSIYLIFSLIPTLSPSELMDFSNLSFVLPFITLLIGFFGRDILGNPTKDLKGLAKWLISLSILVGIVFFLPIIFQFFTI